MDFANCVQRSGKSGGDPVQGKSRTRAKECEECKEREECEECDWSSGSILSYNMEVGPEVALAPHCGH